MNPQTLDSHPPHGPHELTVVVFQENSSSRTFRVPLRWISRLGILLSLFCGVTLASSFLAIKYFRIAQKADVERLQDLENELNDLKALAQPHSTTTAPLVVPMNASPSPTLSAPSSSQKSTEASDFLLFPPTIKKISPDTPLNFTIQNPRVILERSTLKVRFALQYTHDDGGHQEGRIVILARGPEFMMGYPRGIMSKQQSALLNPENGEHFSVSRYREVKADFALSKTQSVQSIEIFILSDENQILIEQKLEVKKDEHTDRNTNEHDLRGVEN